MTPEISNGNAEARFSELAEQYRPKLPRKLALLYPLKRRIEELRAKRASYDSIRILLAEVSIVVSRDTLYRFCRDVIGHKSTRCRHRNGATARHEQESKPFPENRAKQQQRTASAWTPPKRGPRIADSKNL
jgi:hypothetical protein